MPEWDEQGNPVQEWDEEGNPVESATEESPAPPQMRPKPAALPEARFGAMDLLRAVPGAMKDAPREALNYGTGLLKGAGRMAARGADAVLATPMGLGVGMDSLQGLTGLDRQQRIAKIDSMLGLAPKGSAQKVGGVVAEAIPYFTPGAVGKGVGALGKMALEGGKAAAIASGLQGATPGEAAAAGVLGGVGQGITSAAEGAAPYLRKSAVDLFQRAIQPTREHLKVAVERIAPEAVNRGIRGSLEGITKQAGGKVSELAQKLEGVYDDATAKGTTFDATALAQKLDQLKQQFKVTGGGGGTIRPQSEAAIEAMKERVLGQGATITPRDLWETRKALDEIIAGATGAGFDVRKSGVKGATDRVSKAAGKILQDELNTLTPNLKGLNKEFGFWNDLAKGAKSTKTRRVGQESPLAATLVGSGVGSALGYKTGETPQSAGLGMLAGGLAGRQALTLMRSPAWRTASAQVRNNAARLIESGRIDDAVALLGRAVGRVGPAMLGE